MAAAARLDAVIVNFNAGEHLLACVDSLQAEGVSSIVVADNASADGSVEALEAAHPEVRVVRTGANLGMGQGNNRGADGLSGELLLVVNPDVVVHPGAVATLSAAVLADDSIGIVGPRIENVDGTRYPSARRFPSLVDATGHALLGLVWPGNPFTRRYRQDDWDPQEATDVDWVSGACFLIRRSLWDDLGGFDRQYFMYMEDVDICWRAWRHGQRVRFEPGATVTHVQGVSTDQTPYRMIVAHHRSMWRFARTTTTGPTRALLPLMAVGMVVRVAVACGHRWLAGRRANGTGRGVN